jgi:predicted chitinase
MMATAFHETAHTMQPVTEFGGKSYFNKYNAGTRIGRSLGNTQPGDGYRYRGRGYVQITGRANYAKMTKITGVDLVRQPERALEPAVAAQIMFDGMTMGTFTGRALKHYFTPTKADWVNARRIINGTDRAVLISGYAKKFYAALQDGGFEA